MIRRGDVVLVCRGARSARRFCLALALPLAGCGDDGLFPGGHTTLREPFQLEHDATGYSGFQMIGINGEITITGVPDGSSFRASGERRVEDCGEDRAQALMEELEVRLTTIGTEIVVETFPPSDASPCNVVVDYDVTVPTTLEGLISAVNGPVTVDGLARGVSVTTVNGMVTLEDVEDDTMVRVTNGNVTADVAIDGDETIDLQTINGNLALTVPASTSATVVATLANGTISLEGLILLEPVVTQISLTGALGSGEGSIILRTTNGLITLSGR